MEGLKSFIKLPEKQEQKGRKVQRHEEMIADISKQSGLTFGHCLALWTRGGFTELELVLTSFRENPRVNKAKFINWRLKK